MIPHIAISASAGSGKTFQLARRYVALLAHGVTPDRIIALTFSRKAAGEIFDAVVEQLIGASTDAAKAASTAGAIGQPGLAREDFQRLLRLLMNHLARLHVGTLDSFTVGVVRAFPLELGLGLGLELMDGDGTDAMAARREVLSRLFAGGAAGEGARREFIEALKSATFGREEKGLERNLDQFLTDYRAAYRAAPEGHLWGHETAIWPTGRRWPSATAGAEADAAVIRADLEAGGWPQELMDAAERFVAFAAAHTEQGAWNDDVMRTAFVKRLLEAADELAAGRFSALHRRKDYPLAPSGAKALHSLLARVLGVELDRSLRETRGLFLVLHYFEQLYDAQVRRHGRLTFDDVQFLLTQTHRAAGCVLSREVGDPARLYIDYRLDSRLDHWLLDEFQDTSDIQWDALRNLIDEVLQDTSGERSFFYVGDVKQAIYGWRGGNPSLFGRLLARYGARIKRQPLHISYRSAAPVLELVNSVFGSLPEEIPAPVRERWLELWGEHQPSPSVPSAGYACLIEPPRGSDAKPTAEDRHLLAASVLREVEPVRRGLSAAVLARSNDEVRAIVAALRAELPGVPVVQEGVSPLAENPVASLLLSLLHLAAHPGDTFAWRHVEMSPLGPAAAQVGRDRFSHAVLRRVRDEGFESTLRHWGEQLAAAGGMDAYGRSRWEDLLEAAAEFDARGVRDLDAFADFVDGHAVREENPGSAIRVMTIHQSKGLGFDVVILPDLQGRSLVGGAGAGVAVHRDDDEAPPSWVLKMPRRAVAEMDPVLTGELQQQNEASTFEALCVLYVALTRARRAVYVISSFAGARAKAFTGAAFLKVQLAGDQNPERGKEIEVGGQPAECLWAAGARDWYAALESRPAAKSPRGRKPARGKRLAARRRLLQASPSQGAEHARGGNVVFTANARRTRGLGSAVHELLARIDWWPAADFDHALAEWRSAGEWDDALLAEAESHVRAALARPAIAAALAAPAGSAEVWCERSFDVVMDGTWVTGTFDRVVVRRDAAGAITGAEVLDFKTNAIQDEAQARQVAEDYRPQMEAYRRSLAALLGLDQALIRLKLIFTSAGLVHELG